MYVIKRDGRQAPVEFDEVLRRIQEQCYGLDETVVHAAEIAQKVVQGIHKGVTTAQLDILAAETAAHRIIDHPDFGILAGRLSVSNLHKQTPSTFSAAAALIYTHAQQTARTALPDAYVAMHQRIADNAALIDSVIDDQRDYDLSYFGIKTLESSYLLRGADKQVLERPQYMWMRVALGIHGADLDAAFETYQLMSHRRFTHATPTLFNAGTQSPQLASCFLSTLYEDSILGIARTLTDAMVISKYSGGIGVSLHTLRANGSPVRSIRGQSNGIVPKIRMFNNAALCVNQGSKRPGAVAIYLEPWHADIEDFLELKFNNGKEEHRARDLFYGLWVPDLFMQRVKENGMWTLMCPDAAPGLADVWGDAFETLYKEYEAQPYRCRKTMRAQELWRKILSAQMETGTPYMLYKDAANRKSNQQHLGTIRGSNLCTEIIQYSSPSEVAVCNLASIGLPTCVDASRRTFDFDMLASVTRVVTRNLNKNIDINLYPVPEAETSNLRHRPIGIGVQGLADVFFMMELPYVSDAARQLNRDIFETIYYAAVSESCVLAKEQGPYESFPGSPASQGRLQFDLWGVAVGQGRYSADAWAELAGDVRHHGLRNSLLTAPMPTASTSQILGFTESFEPLTNNVYSRRTLAGDFQVINTYLVRDLIARGQWNNAMRHELLRHRGSVQAIESIGDDLKQRYKTVWEISQKAVLHMSADRGVFIDQSQSLNIHLSEPTLEKLHSVHMEGWQRGLKTGMYYLRTLGAVAPIAFTVASAPERPEEPVQVCELQGECVSCSS